MTSKLTIGMAVYDDFVNTWHTVESLRLFHILPDGLDAEILVIDNHPGSHADSRRLSNFCASWGNTERGPVRYVRMEQPTGTTQPRNRVFEEARGDFVLCMDNHVHLVPGSLKRLVEWCDANPDSQDIVSGPILADDMRVMSTHWDAVWRDEMWGIWAQAWQCKCRDAFNEPLQFSTCEIGGKVGFRNLITGQLVSKCGCSTSLPHGIEWSAHEPKLEALGYYRLGSSPDDAPFEIPGMGLGVFACRRDAWLGFNRECRGFGGEEMCIHEKYRKAGHKALCLPFLRWLHLFRDPLSQTKYPGTLEDKVANYVLWFRELGMDLTPIHEHFVKHGRLNERVWQQIVNNPTQRAAVTPPAPCHRPSRHQQHFRR